MRKRMFIGVLVAALAVVLAGGLLASNMGFKLNYTLVAAGQAVPETAAGGNGLSQDGTNDLSLPDFPQTGLATASNLITDIGIQARGGVSKFIRDNNSLQTYTGVLGTKPDFALVAGDAYRVRVTGAASVPYIIVGSHNPSLSHTLIAAGQPVPETAAGGNGLSQDGTNTYNYPYHSVAATASALIAEIGPAARGGVSKFIRDNNSLQTYTGLLGTKPDFALVPGAAYRVRITGTSNISFVPNHY
jgi:hypothetical protein